MVLCFLCAFLSVSSSNIKTEASEINGENIIVVEDDTPSRSTASVWYTISRNGNYVSVTLHYSSSDYINAVKVCPYYLQDANALYATTNYYSSYSSSYTQSVSYAKSGEFNIDTIYLPTSLSQVRITQTGGGVYLYSMSQYDYIYANLTNNYININ